MKTDPRQRGTGPLAGGERTSGRLRPPASSLEELERTAAPNTERTTVPNVERAGVPSTASSMRKLTPSEINTAMVHFYRGEIQRANTWRNRLDTTTNWAVITAGATLSFAFSSHDNPHFVILINSVLVAFFLFMEARRYRYYEIWSSRVRVIETGYFAQLLQPEGKVNNDWAEHLASDLNTPHFTISEWEAVGRRLRRNYLWLFVLLAMAWNLKVYLHPRPAVEFAEFLDRAAVGVIPGEVVFGVGVLFNAGLLIFAIATVRLREATGEVLPRHEFSLRTFTRMPGIRSVAAARSRNANLRRMKKARHRVRTTGTTGTATGEFRKIEVSQTPDKERLSEKTLT
jgi:uncharacterized membrane protein